MIIVDTMVWANHIGRSEPVFAELLAIRRIAMHPYVIGELALGNLPDRAILLSSLARCPKPRSPKMWRCWA